MAEINIADSRKRDAVVSAESVTLKQEVRYIDENGVQATNRKVLRSTVDNDIDVLLAAHGDLEGVSHALIEGDPEVDVEKFGAYLSETSRVYVNPDNKIVHKVNVFEIVRDPEGEEKERRPRKITESNVATEIPLKWTGKMMKKSEVYNRFVFSGKMQITHVNGLTYDFLYTMAKELAEAESMMLVGSGPKSNEPLIFRRGGTAYRGFLEGRVEGDQYALILHLTNLEFKAPEPKAEEKA